MSFWRLSPAVVAGFAAAAFAVNAAAVPPPAGYNQLQTNYVLKDTDPGGWAGSGGTLEVTANNTLPFDTSVTYNGLPSLRVNNKRRARWWLAMIVPRGWATADIENYYANGNLEFNIKGAAGGEVFYVGVGDRAYERYVGGTLTESIKPKKLITEFIPAVTTSWQHVTIPLRNLIDPASGFITSQLWTVEVSNSIPGAMQFWLNEIKFTSPDKERSYPHLKLNQVGYTTAAEKYALVTGWYEELATVGAGTAFQVKRASDAAVMFSGTLTLLTDYEPNVSGDKMLKADFSGFSTPGTYYVSVPGLVDSAPFTIGSQVYRPLLVDATRYYYFQRANLALVAPYADGYPHDPWHPDDFNCPLESTLAVKQDVHGGWYDAGDFGKYTSPTSTTVSDLMWAYDTFPAEFTDAQLNIPESGNGEPDLVDEIRLGVDLLLRLQDPATGGFWARVFPQTKTDARYISDVVGAQTKVKPTAHTGAATAALARASVFFRDRDPAYADLCLQAARRGWDYLVAHPTLVPAPSGPYSDNDDANDRFWAAAELFRATGEAAFNQYFLAQYQSFAGIFGSQDNAHGVGGMEFPAFFAYMKAASPDPTVVSFFTTSFNSWRSINLSRATGFWRNTNADEDYYWGSNMPILNTTMDLVIGSKILGNYDSSIVRVARSNLNFVLGTNPLSMSYVHGYGANSHQNVYSAIYSDDGLTGAPAGYMSGGANMYEGRWFSRFNAKCYSDADTEWTTNEHTIYWNSGLVFSAALADAEAATP